MREMSINELVGVLNGQLLQGREDLVIKGFSTDTRKIGFGDLFFALIGENFDAHNFVDKATALGAGGLVIANPNTKLPPNIPTILVDDTLIALQKLASYIRRQSDIPVIAVTGSNGKTTTKDIIASILAQELNVLKTKANFNNEIGLPLTLLDLQPDHQAVVLEMGMRAEGEITELCTIAKPNIGVITNIGESHIEILGSREAIGRAKTELLTAIGRSGIAIINGDDSLLTQLAHDFTGKKIRFGFNPVNDIYAQAVHIDQHGNTCFDLVYNNNRRSIRMPIPGKHNVLNALAAVGVGIALDIALDKIVQGLEVITLSEMRSQVTQCKGYTVINDAYNASPSSTEAALEVLSAFKGQRKIAVLGDMLELGEYAEQGHRRIGRKIIDLNVNLLFTVGELTTYINDEAKLNGMSKSRVYSFRNNKDVLKALKSIVRTGDTILIKGSRSMRMEEIVYGLLD